MNIVEFAENVLGLKLLDYQKKYLKYLSMFYKDKCQECKKDWTKCGRCPVMMNWVKSRKRGGGMTREEAIADIRDNIKPIVGGKSLDMAIEALEKINKIDKIAHIKSVEDLNGLNCEETILGLFKTVLEENKIRNATPEEQKLVDDYIKSISKPTGVDFGALEQEPCEDCISRKEALDICLANAGHGYIWKQIKSLPPVTAEKAGQWIEERTYMKCPNCYDIWHYEENQTERFRYCPTCGRKMEVEVKE